jgi:L-alanine-DL-glutamate epimerase-like enolase superfamily enzyme
MGNVKIIAVDVILTAAGWRNFVLVKIQTDSGLVGWEKARSVGKKPPSEN